MRATKQTYRLTAAALIYVCTHAGFNAVKGQRSGQFVLNFYLRYPRALSQPARDLLQSRARLAAGALRADIISRHPGSEITRAELLLAASEPPFPPVPPRPPPSNIQPGTLFNVSVAVRFPAAETCEDVITAGGEEAKAYAVSFRSKYAAAYGVAEEDVEVSLQRARARPH